MDYMSSKVWDKITYSSPNFNGTNTMVFCGTNTDQWLMSTVVLADVKIDA